MTSIKVLIESVEVEHEGEKRERKERKGCDDQLPGIHNIGSNPNSIIRPKT